MEGNDFMSMNVTFGAGATAQEKAEAKASAKTSLIGTAITAAGGAMAGGTVGTIASFLPCKPSVEKVIEGMNNSGDSALKSLAQDFFDKRANFANIADAKKIADEIDRLKGMAEPTERILAQIEALTDRLKELPNPKNFESVKLAYENAKDAVVEKATDLIKNAPDSDLVKAAKEATKSMLRPNKIAKGAIYGVMIALAYNIISSFRKPKEQNVQTTQA